MEVAASAYPSPCDAALRSREALVVYPPTCVFSPVVPAASTSTGCQRGVREMNSLLENYEVIVDINLFLCLLCFLYRTLQTYQRD